jgi:23S rRNA (cytosine1962-C5)-methyltransferase
MLNEYELLDSGDGRKLERFGAFTLSRPCPQASWGRQLPESWERADAAFDREQGWVARGSAELPSDWVVTINGIAMRLKATPAGHIGVFPETRALWDWIADASACPTPDGAAASVLNLFAYSGGATLAAARAGAAVCHLDASRSMVTRARENAALNGLDGAPIRWIVEDVGKFLNREIRRGRRYDAIMLDPPSFGHGVKGEQYRIDRDLVATLGKCATLLAENPAFVLLTSHTQGVTVGQLESVMRDVLGSGDIASGRMELTGASGVRAVESGVWTRWAPSKGAACRVSS